MKVEPNREHSYKSARFKAITNILHVLIRRFYFRMET